MQPEQPHLSPLRSLSIWLMVGLIGCFIVEQIVVVHWEKPYDAYLGLSGYGMKSLHLWELVTYQFVHLKSEYLGEMGLYRSIRGFLHLAINLAGLWCLGRAFEARFGAKKFLLVYFGAGVAGAVLQGIVGLAYYWLLDYPSLESVSTFIFDRFGGQSAGASVGLCGLFAVLCCIQPSRKKWLWVALGLALLLVIIPSDPDLAHLSHLGALIAGMVLCRGVKMPQTDTEQKLQPAV